MKAYICDKCGKVVSEEKEMLHTPKLSCTSEIFSGVCWEKHLCIDCLGLLLTFMKEKEAREQIASKNGVKLEMITSDASLKDILIVPVEEDTKVLICVEGVEITEEELYEKLRETIERVKAVYK